MTTKEIKRKDKNINKMLELYRALIPASKIINDNHGQHYRIHTGNLQWLSEQYDIIKNGGYKRMVGRGENRHEEFVNFSGPSNFVMPECSNLNYSNFNDENIPCSFSLRCEIWRPGNQRWDSQNYSKTFKPAIDCLVKDGYIIDDSWKYINNVTFSGGGPDVWKERAYRYKNDGLPDEFTIDWWREELKLANIEVKNTREDLNHIMIRIILK